MTRMKLQLTRDRVRLQSQMECLLEEMRIKLSLVVSDLLGASGLRILRALAEGETDPKQLARLGDKRLQCTEEQLVDALTGRVQPMHREMLALQRERLQLIDTQIAKLNSMIAQAMKPHQEAVLRLAEVPGLGVGFGAANHRGSGRAGQYLPLGRGVDLLGGNLSRERRKCRTEPQQSLR